MNYFGARRWSISVVDDASKHLGLPAAGLFGRRAARPRKCCDHFTPLTTLTLKVAATAWQEWPDVVINM